MQPITRALLALAAIGIASGSLNCVDPPVAPPIAPLADTYTGTYRWIVGEGEDRVITEQAITWTFTDSTYLMDAAPTDSAYKPDVCFCKARGTYAVTDRIRLGPSGSLDLPDNCESCDTTRSPAGMYAISRPSGGVRLMRMFIVGDVPVANEIILQRVLPAQADRPR